MSNSSLRLIGYGLLAFAVVLVASALFRTRRSAPRCPGPRLRSPLWFAPLSWFWFGGCRYSLFGLRADEEGTVRCPECGRRIPHSTSVHAVFRRRTLRVAGLVALAGIGVALSPHARGKWPRLIPTFALVVTDRVTEMPPEDLRRELDRRIKAGRVSGRTAEGLIAAAVDDLRNDDTRGNAVRAMDILEQYGWQAVPALEDALLSSDYQQRQAAASLLRRLREYVPTDTLLHVTYEGMANDNIPYERGVGFTILTFNGGAGYNYLTKHAERAAPLIERGMDSPDAQQRMLSLGVAARSKAPRLVDAATPRLVEALRDNDIRLDARQARRHLRLIGPRAIPALEAALDSDDEQQRRYAAYVLDHIRKDEARKAGDS